MTGHIFARSRTLWLQTSIYDLVHWNPFARQDLLLYNETNHEALAVACVVNKPRRKQPYLEVCIGRIEDGCVLGH